MASSTVEDYIPVPQLEEKKLLLNGRYEIKDTLYESPKSTILKAYDTSSKKDVIIKKLQRFRPDDVQIKEELEILNYLKDFCSEYIICFNQYFADESNHYFVTEYLGSYIDLRTYIKSMKNIDSLLFWNDPSATEELYKRSKIICNLIQGMNLIHDLDVVHFDIKPENIIIDPNTLKIKYIDFGLSCLKDRCNRYIGNGTPLYEAPEILIPDAEYKYTLSSNKLADPWSLGMTIFELLTSRPYFDPTVYHNILDLKTSLANFNLNLKSKMGDALYNFINREEPTLIRLLNILLDKNPNVRSNSRDTNVICLPRSEEKEYSKKAIKLSDTASRYQTPPERRIFTKTFKPPSKRDLAEIYKAIPASATTFLPQFGGEFKFEFSPLAAASSVPMYKESPSSITGKTDYRNTRKRKDRDRNSVNNLDNLNLRFKNFNIG